MDKKKTYKEKYEEIVAELEKLTESNSGPFLHRAIIRILDSAR